MKTLLQTAILISGLLLTASCAASRPETKASDNKKTDVLATYYPHWHTYPDGEHWFGKNWTEWEFVKTAKPRFKGHKQPIEPIAGYLDGKNPEDVEKEIEFASNSGIDVFVFDWYWYGGRSMMEESLEQGFLKADNNKKMKFALMWAYHDRRNAFRPTAFQERKVLAALARTPEDFNKALEYCIENYFKKPNYYKIDNRVYFSIFDAPSFIKDMGGAENCKKLFEKAARTMRENNLQPVHWSAMIHTRDEAELAAKAGFDSTTIYNLCSYPNKKPIMEGEVYDYADVVDFYDEHRRGMVNLSIPFIPSVIMGWDTTARCHPDVNFPWPAKAGYPYCNSVTNNTPDLFKRMLKGVKDYTENTPNSPRAILINAWNEYTEGSYVVPNKRDADGYLRAVAAVFGRNPSNEYVYADDATKEICRVRAADFENVAYGKHAKNKLDIWLPKNAKGNTPVVVYFNGYDWNGGSIEDKVIEESLDALLDKGVAVICADYRQLRDAADADIFPPIIAPMEDCAKAVEFVRKNASKWNINPEKIAVCGNNAGATSAIFAGMKNNAAAIGAIAPQTTLDYKDLHNGLETYRACAAFGCKNFDELSDNSDKNAQFVKKYSPDSIAANFAGKSAPKILVSDDKNFMYLYDKFKKACKDKGIDCETTSDGASETLLKIADLLK